MAKNKLTAVKWLKANLPSLLHEDSGHYEKLFKKAVKMEKKQIEDAFVCGKLSRWFQENENTDSNAKAVYYEEIYGKE